MTNGFQRAVKTTAKARIGLYGVSGSGKTMHALTLARILAGADGTIALLDCEGGSSAKYADMFEYDMVVMHPPFHPQRFADALKNAIDSGYTVFVADGVSPFWDGEGGVMTIVDEGKKRGGGWADGTPAHNKLVNAILTSPIHVIVTIRAKSETVIEKDERGRTQIRKIGMKMVQRDGLDYELDALLYLDLDNSATVEKSRWANQLGLKLPVDRVPEWSQGFKDWLDSGSERPRPAPAPEAAPVVAAPAPPSDFETRLRAELPDLDDLSKALIKQTVEDAGKPFVFASMVEMMQAAEVDTVSDWVVYLRGMAVAAPAAASQPDLTPVGESLPSGVTGRQTGSQTAVTINDRQGRMFHARVGEVGLSADEKHELLRRYANCEHTRDIKATDFDDLLKILTDIANGGDETRQAYLETS